MLLEISTIAEVLTLILGCYFLFLAYKTEKAYQIFRIEAESNRINHLVELQEIRNAIIDLTDATEDIEIPQQLSPVSQPDLLGNLPLPVQLGLSFLKSMKEGQTDSNGSETSSERQIYEVQETNTENDSSTSEETQEILEE